MTFNQLMKSDNSDAYAQLMQTQSEAVDEMSNLGGAQSDLLEAVAKVAAQCTDSFTSQLTAAAAAMATCKSTSACDIEETKYNTLNTQGTNMTSAANTATSVGSQMVQGTQSAVVNALNNMRPAIDNANAIAQCIAALR